MLKVRLLGASALGSIAGVLIPGIAAAQATPSTTQPDAVQAAVPDSQQVEGTNSDGSESTDGTVTVTGSRIPRPETDGVLPGVSISAQQIQTRGFTNALEALNDIPMVGPGASPLTGNNGGQTASLGAAFVDLLDLGTQRTLTLVNGRRFVSGNAASLFVEGNATGAQVDVNVIPSTLIAKIDVLTVGGAAAYGADAISGVVNIILREDFEGLTARAQAGVTERGDAPTYQLAATYGMNFMDGRGNIVLSGEYTRSDGLQADARSFRRARTNSYTNPFNGSTRNPAFASAIIDIAGANNGAFLRAADDGLPSSLFAAGFVNQGLSFNGTVFNALSPATAYTPYTPITGTATIVVGGTPTVLPVTTNFITFSNGLSPVGVRLAGTTSTGVAASIPSTNNAFFSSAGQIIPGLPGVGYTGTFVLNQGGVNTSYTLSGNGLNTRTTPIASLPITTFAPTALPAGVTAAQVFAQFGITPPTGSTAGQQSTLAINVLQANRFTAREFFAANPNVNVNYFIGTFVPSVPKIANTDTTLVTVRTSQAGGTIQVPVNQVLPFVAVPLEFQANGDLRTYTAASGTTPTSPLTVAQTQGSDGGFFRSLENIVLRTQQDRYVANLIGHFDLNDEITFFTENTYANVTNRSLKNSPSQNFLSNTSENAPLLINYNTNPYLTAQNKGVLTSVGINATNPNFVVVRQNQDIFGANPFVQKNETYRIVAGLRSNYEMFGQRWTAEVSGTFGRAVSRTHATQINDIEYQLALDAVDQGLATTGVANGNIVCRAKVFPGQYLGRTPIGTAPNIVRQRNAAGELAESLFTPTITQAMIDACQPLNPFGYNNMSQASKDYVAQQQLFKNVSEQTLVTASFGGALFDLPAGPLAVSVNGEYRKDKLRFTSNLLNQLGRGRAAPSSNFGAFTETYEIGAEARIPLTGPDFLPFLGRLEFNPAVRVTQQDGAADVYRNRLGVLQTPTSNGKAQTIYSLAGTWAPVRDISFRANYTQSVRQPSVVELFLGGQPVFSTPTDYCGPTQIDAGPAVRRTNCQNAVVAAGLASTTAAAGTFLQTYNPFGVGLSGTYGGNTNLSPEKATSWTAGGVLTPRWVPGLTVSADYIHLNLRDTIIPTGLSQALMSCYDSPTYPDTTAQLGANLCNSFTRDTTNFQVANGYELSFLNLGSINVRAWNISAAYPLGLGNLGKLNIRANAYHLAKFITSASGDFSLDGLRSDGTFSRPKWETQLNLRYEKGPVYVSGTWNYRTATRIFTNGAPAGIEVYPFNRYPAYSLFDAAIGADVTEDFRLQFAVTNLTDKNYGGDLGYLFQDYIDQIGRRFQVTATAKF